MLVRDENRTSVSATDVATVLNLDPYVAMRSCYFLVLAGEPWWTTCATLDDFDRAFNAIVSVRLAAETRDVIDSLASIAPNTCRYMHPYHALMSNVLYREVAKLVADRITLLQLIRNAVPVTTTTQYRISAKLRFETLALRVRLQSATLQQGTTQPTTPFVDPYTLVSARDLADADDADSEPFAHTRAPY